MNALNLSLCFHLLQLVANNRREVELLKSFEQRIRSFK